MAHIDQAIDIGHATLQNVRKNRCPLTFAYENYDFYNSFLNGRIKEEGGDYVEREIALSDEGNAELKDFWGEETKNVKNITKKFTVNWVRAVNNFSYNAIEISINKSPEQIYDYLQLKYDNCVREFADLLLPTFFNTPTSSSDSFRPHGISSWLTWGTDGSTGGWNGQDGHYSDGSATTYDRGGISASTYSRWASYYADHDGNLDDSLLELLDVACRKLSFSPPMHPNKVDTLGGKGRFSIYTNDNVIKNVNSTLRKWDDQAGSRMGNYFMNPVIKGVPMRYVPLLDVANSDTYKTDPIFGIDHNLLYPVVLSDWDFKVDKPRLRQNQSTVLDVAMNFVYTIVCDNPRHAGFLINQQ